MRILSLLPALFALVASPGGAGASGCEKDTDCKGARICVRGECTDPPHASREGDSLHVFCTFAGEEVDTSRLAIEEEGPQFASLAEAQRVTKEILDSLGLAPNFVIAAANVPNAAAAIRGSTRYVLYNPNFMTQARSASGTPWGPKSIIAHEIGHHLQGHTLQNGGSSPDKEIEADEYSGGVMANMGATLEQAEAAMRAIASDGDSPTHPGRSKRLAAIDRGWRRARELQTRRIEGATPPAGKAGRDSCEYANDGECDEPTLCEIGTDTTDCAGGRSARTDIEQPTPVVGAAIASMCYTPYGACPMRVPVPRGSMCSCFYPPYPPVGGVAQ